jgi:hypothetical protein
MTSSFIVKRWRQGLFLKYLGMPVRRPEYDTSESCWASEFPRIISYTYPAHRNSLRVQTPGTHLAFVGIILTFDYWTMWSKRWASPADWFMLQTARLLLPNDLLRHVYLSWHDSPNQMWATGIMKNLLFATSVVLAWLPQLYVINMHYEDTGEWSFSPRLFSWHGCPNHMWSTCIMRSGEWSSSQRLLSWHVWPNQT